MLTTIHSELRNLLEGAVVLPGDAGWDEARSGFNLLLDQHPAAVAFPVDARDVAAAVAYARRAGLRVAPQATAHNQGPLGDLEGTLLLNVSALQEVAEFGVDRCEHGPMVGGRTCAVDPANAGSLRWPHPLG